jgi:hypothetical protein
MFSIVIWLLCCLSFLVGVWWGSRAHESDLSRDEREGEHLSQP